MAYARRILSVWFARNDGTCTGKNHDRPGLQMIGMPDHSRNTDTVVGVRSGLCTPFLGSGTRIRQDVDRSVLLFTSSSGPTRSHRACVGGRHTGILVPCKLRPLLKSLHHKLLPEEHRIVAIVARQTSAIMSLKMNSPRCGRSCTPERRSSAVPSAQVQCLCPRRSISSSCP